MTSAEALVALLIERHLTIGVAESLTGGLLVSRLIDVPGASATVSGGVVAYDTRVKHSLLGVDASILNVHGPVHPDVAGRMAVRVRDVVAIDGVSADVGVATTGVAGPDSQDGHAPGTAFVGIAIGGDVRVVSLNLSGSRDEIRRGVVDRAVEELYERIENL